MNVAVDLDPVQAKRVEQIVDQRDTTASYDAFPLEIRVDPVTDRGVTVDNIQTMETDRSDDPSVKQDDRTEASSFSNCSRVRAIHCRACSSE